MSGKLLLHSLTVCTLAIAVMLCQAMFNTSANGQKPGAEGGGRLLDRIANLELQQDQLDQDFFLVDQSIGNLDARVSICEARGRTNQDQIANVESRMKDAIDLREAEHRDLVRKVAELRSLIQDK
ncbi:hypothetical protein OAL43_00350 [bacterium]|nr:hypothetical protein [bacterium]MDC0295502.1 hypothetical protein [bacterium]